MPPRYAYWTILVDDQPTAFRAASQDELMPTFKRVKEKQPTAKLMWFQNGKLWDSRIDAQEAMRARGEMGRRGDVRQSDSPGYRNRDASSSRPSFKSSDPSVRPEWKPRSDSKPQWKSQPEGPPRGTRTDLDKPEWKPKSDRADWKPKFDSRADRSPKASRPRSNESSVSSWKPKRDSGDRAPWKPKSDRADWKPKFDSRADRSPKASRPRSNESSVSSWKPKRDTGDRPPWKPKGEATARPEWKPKSDRGESRPRSDSRPAWKGKPGPLEWTPKSGHTGAKPTSAPEKRKWVPKEEYKKSMGIEARRDSKWRPGGEHKDPKQKYKDAKKAKWGRFKDGIRKRWEAKGGKKRGD